MIDTIREAHGKDELFLDIAAYFCGVDEKIPSGFLSTMHWYSVDPQSNLLYFIREGERRLYIQRNPQLIKFIIHGVHDVPFAAHPGLRSYAQTLGSFCTGHG